MEDESREKNARKMMEDARGDLGQKQRHIMWVIIVECRKGSAKKVPAEMGYHNGELQKKWKMRSSVSRRRRRRPARQLNMPWPTHHWICTKG